MALKDLTEAEIMQKVKNLSQESDLYADVIKQYFQEIFHRYYYQCYNLSRYYGLTRQDAEDAVQESFIRLMRGAVTYDENRPFKPWFFRVVMNSVRDKYRDLKKHRYTELENIEQKPSENQEKIFEELQIRDTLQSIINRLPEKMKIAVVLRNYSNMGLEDIAKHLKITVRQLHNRLAKAYEILEKKLMEKRDG